MPFAQHMRPFVWTALGIVLAAVAYAVWPVTAPLGEAEISTQLLKEQIATYASVRRDHVTRWRPVLDPLNQLGDFVQEADEGLKLRLGLEDPWLEIPWGEPEAPKRSATLFGKRIFIDPGHRGGTWSVAEERHFRTPFGEIREGDLTYMTAVVLRDMLQELGAMVELSRGPPPDAAVQDTFMEGFSAQREAQIWLRRRSLLKHPEEDGLQPWFAMLPMRLARWRLQWHAQKLIVEDLAAAHVTFDLRRRSQMAATFNADVTLSLHYNVARDPRINKFVVLMPGNALEDEFVTEAQRGYALRRLVEGRMDDIERLAEHIAEAMGKRLGVPPAPAPEPGAPARKLSVIPQKGVYARNLALLKRTPGPVLLLEGPCMNNHDEAQRLTTYDTEWNGQKIPSRILDYARTVVEGLQAGAELF